MRAGPCGTIAKWSIFGPGRLCTRAALSVPASRALADGLLDGDVLDYGCGRGGDVRRLRSAGVAAWGWDPHYRPEPPASPAAAVLCLYVLNVVDDPLERVWTLRQAWELCTGVLVLAVRTDRERGKVRGAPVRDGVLTSRGTFQALLPEQGLAAWVEEAVGRRPVPAGPGLLYVFRADAARARYLVRRFTRPVRAEAAGPGAGGAADPERAAAGLAGWLADRGRPPGEGEDPALHRELRLAFGGPARVRAAADTLLPPGIADRAAARATDDLLVLLALDAFHGRTRAADLPVVVAEDCRAFFGGYAAARRKAGRLLALLGRRDLLAQAARVSRVGKLTPTGPVRAHGRRAAPEQSPAGVRRLRRARRRPARRLQHA